MIIDNRELTPQQIAQAKMAGIPADRPGLLDTYPRMLYKKGEPDLNEASHNLATDANGGTALLPIGGHKNIITRIVLDEDEELTALGDGWETNVDRALKVGEKPAKQAA